MAGLQRHVARVRVGPSQRRRRGHRASRRVPHAGETRQGVAPAHHEGRHRRGDQGVRGVRGAGPGELLKPDRRGPLADDQGGGRVGVHPHARRRQARGVRRGEPSLRRRRRFAVLQALPEQRHEERVGRRGRVRARGVDRADHDARGDGHEAGALRAGVGFQRRIPPQAGAQRPQGFRRVRDGEHPVQGCVPVRVPLRHRRGGCVQAARAGGAQGGRGSQRHRAHHSERGAVRGQNGTASVPGGSRPLRPVLRRRGSPVRHPDRRALRGCRGAGPSDRRAEATHDRGGEPAVQRGLPRPRPAQRDQRRAGALQRPNVDEQGGGGVPAGPQASEAGVLPGAGEEVHERVGVEDDAEQGREGL
mmetsp:Transcript_11555/g.46531  ORF Transcript_11555/g.46531 Transcript_11555/m.46531 type:complete len:361 (-) Transcript_11555:391-1473(-)